MSAIERITKAAHLIDMKDIIRYYPRREPCSSCCCRGSQLPLE